MISLLTHKALLLIPVCTPFPCTSLPLLAAVLLSMSMSQMLKFQINETYSICLSVPGLFKLK
jgi:hypothetical protein